MQYYVLANRQPASCNQLLCIPSATSWQCQTVINAQVLQNEAENGKMHAQVNISANWPNKNEIKTLKDFHKQRLLW